MMSVLRAETQAVNQTIRHSSALILPANDEAESLKDPRGIVRVEILQQPFRGLRLPRFFQHRHRVTYVWIVRAGDLVSNFDFFGYGRIGLVNDPGFCVPRLNRSERSTDVLSWNDFALHSGPKLLFLEILFGVDSGGNGSWLGKRESLDPGHGELIWVVNSRPSFGGHDNDEHVREAAFA